MLLDFIGADAHCWLMPNLASIRIPKSLSAKLLSCWVALCMTLCLGLFPSEVRNFLLPLVKLHEVSVGHFFSLLRSLWVTAWPCGISAIVPSSVSPAPSSRIWTGPNPDPWGTLLVGGLHLDSVPLITTLLLVCFPLHYSVTTCSFLSLFLRMIVMFAFPLVSKHFSKSPRSIKNYWEWLHSDIRQLIQHLSVH